MFFVGAEFPTKRRFCGGYWNELSYSQGQKSAQVLRKSPTLLVTPLHLLAVSEIIRALRLTEPSSDDLL